MSSRQPEEGQKPLPDPISAFKQLYDQAWRQAAEQWDQLLRNPLFLSTMATNIEQAMNLTARVQEMVANTLKTMNLPTRDDVQQIKSSVQALRQEVAELHRKIDNLQPPAKPKKRSRRSA
jgi:polyhydroxyalkanoate synthesis regulator phasin